MQRLDLILRSTVNLKSVGLIYQSRKVHGAHRYGFTIVTLTPKHVLYFTHFPSQKQTNTSKKLETEN